jgi:hypothetical protein
MSSRYRLGLLPALGAVLGLSLAVSASAETVLGSSNPYLAGMPNGSMCCAGDSAPAQSPVLVVSVAITPGSTVTFSVTGSVDNTGAPPTLPPDGGAIIATPSNDGISGATWPINALVGVFLDASQPDLSSAPAGLDFSGGGVGTSFTTLSPALKQAFFIGDGLTGTGTGSVQTFVVPAGATRLFLGTSDGFGWFNNSGTFNVTPAAGGAPASAVPMLTPAMLVVLGAALAIVAVFLMRRA